MYRCFAAALIGALVVLPFCPANAAEPAPREPYGIDLEGFAYPYPVNLMPIVNDGDFIRGSGNNR